MHVHSYNVQAMDAAPTDATPILGWLPRKQAWVAMHWRPGWKGWFTIPGEYCVVPSHWMPMPSAPGATNEMR